VSECFFGYSRTFFSFLSFLFFFLLVLLLLLFLFGSACFVASLFVWFCLFVSACRGCVLCVCVCLCVCMCARMHLPFPVVLPFFLRLFCSLLPHLAPPLKILPFQNVGYACPCASFVLSFVRLFCPSFLFVLDSVISTTIHSLVRFVAILSFCPPFPSTFRCLMPF
jgi:hypothetical protein